MVLVVIRSADWSPTSPPQRWARTQQATRMGATRSPDGTPSPSTRSARGCFVAQRVRQHTLHTNRGLCRRRLWCWRLGPRCGRHCGARRNHFGFARGTTRRSHWSTARRDCVGVGRTDHCVAWCNRSQLSDTRRHSNVRATTWFGSRLISCSDCCRRNAARFTRLCRWSFGDG